jgi:hypothetical protein
MEKYVEEGGAHISDANVLFLWSDEVVKLYIY